MFIDIVEGSRETTLYVAGPIGHHDASALRCALEFACSHGSDIEVRVSEATTAEVALVRMLVSMKLRTYRARIMCHWAVAHVEPVAVPASCERQMSFRV